MCGMEKDMEQKIKIDLRSRRTEIAEQLMKSLFETVLMQGGEEEAENATKEEILFRDPSDRDVEQDVIEMSTEGTLRIADGRVEISYDESELTGMEGATTCVSFATDAPGLVTMMRGGTVTTALVFEPHRRHICVYHTPFMPFEICVYSSRVDNRLLDLGTLDLDYIIELRGAQAERTRFTMKIRTLEDDTPLERPEVMLKGMESGF